MDNVRLTVDVPADLWALATEIIDEDGAWTNDSLVRFALKEYVEKHATAELVTRVAVELGKDYQNALVHKWTPKVKRGRGV